MVDFSKLRVPTPEERAERDARYAREAAERDLKDRQSKIKHSHTITLNEDAESRFSLTGDREIHLRGLDERGRPLRATFPTPVGMDRDQSDALTASLTQGSSAKLDGYFRPHQDRAGKTHFTLMVMTLGNDHTRSLDQAAWDRQRSAEQTGEDARVTRARSQEQAAWDAERPQRQRVEDRDAAVMAEARAFADLVRDSRDETLRLSAQRRTLVDRYTEQKAHAAESLGALAQRLPPHFEHLPEGTVRQPGNAFLVIDLEATRHRRDPLDRQTAVRTMALTTLGEDLYVQNRSDAGAGPLPVGRESVRTDEPDRPDLIHWDDLRRHADQARATPPGGPRDFLVLPLDGPVAAHPSLTQAAEAARRIAGGEAGEIQALADTSARIRAIGERLDAITETVLTRAAAIAGLEKEPVYDYAKIEAVADLTWHPSRDRFTDALTARRPAEGHDDAAEALNDQPLAQAVLTYVAAKGRENWTQILDLPHLHGDLHSSRSPAPAPRIEIRGSRDIAEARAPGITGGTEYEAMQRGERTVLSTGTRTGADTPLDGLKPGDVVRLHQSRRGEPATGHLDLMVTDRPTRLGGGRAGEDLAWNAKLEGITPEAMTARVARLGELAQVPVRVISSDAVARPRVAVAARAADSHER